jgi:WD40 repeat protein
MHKTAVVMFQSLACIALFLLIIATGADALTSDPIIQLDTGMHNVSIYSMAVNQQRTFMVSASGKQVRVWSLPDGKLVRTIRVPIDTELQGNIVDTAISPDGETIVCGGHTYTAKDNFHVYFFDRRTRKMTRRVGGFPDRIRVLDYSPDGRSIAVGLFKGGIRIIDAATFTITAEAADFPGSVRSLSYDRTGRLVAGAQDGSIFLYDRGLKVIARTKTRSGDWATVRFSPDGSLVAAADSGRPDIEILSGRDLQYQYSPPMPDAKDKFFIGVGWSPDGRKLYAAGNYAIEGRYVVGVFDNAGRGTPRWFKVANNTITTVCGLASGGFVYASADPALGAMEDGGKRIFSKTNVGLDYRGTTLLLSADGSALGVKFNKDRKILYRFSLIDGDFEENARRDAELLEPVMSASGINITGMKTREPKLDDRKLPIDSAEVARYLAIVPGGQSFMLAGDFYLYHFERTGRLIWKKRTFSLPWVLNVAQNGKVVVAGLLDGTTRWYRVSDGAELASMFRVIRFDQPRKPWVAWTPKGYYASSPGADSVLGWHVNNGWDREADFYTIERFRKTYNRPEVLAAVARTYDEKEALKLAGQPAGPSSVASALPPLVRITSPAEGARVSGNTVPVTFTVQSPSGEAVTSVKVLVDGRPIPQTRDIVLEGGSPASPTARGISRTVDVPVNGPGNTISVIAVTKYSTSETASVRVVKTGAQQAAADGYTIKPKLYILSIGVSKYTKHPENNLRFAAKDAVDFAAAMNAQKGKLYRDVTAKVLTDAQATRENVVDGLQWLKRSATQHDVAMIFMSSHGDNSSGQYYFIPSDFEKARLESTSVLFTYIKDAVASIPGKVIVFMDTCHAGDVLGKRGTKAIAPNIDGIVNELVSAENGAVVFTSSTGRQQSLEDAKWNNGAFTRALVDGLGGKADLTGKGRVTINMLDVYLSERVKELTGGRQSPTTAKPQTIQDFPIAVVR